MSGIEIIPSFFVDPVTYTISIVEYISTCSVFYFFHIGKGVYILEAFISSEREQ